LAFSVSADTMTRVTGPGGSAAAPASTLDVGSHAIRALGALDVGRMAVTAAVSKGAVLVDLEVAAVAVAALEATAVSAMEPAVASVVELAAASVEVVDISRFSSLVNMFFDLA
jgi:UDP-N-acetylglucosamine enolpyruvyl transferase